MLFVPSQRWDFSSPPLPSTWPFLFLGSHHPNVITVPHFLSRPLRCAELNVLCGHALEVPAPAPRKASPQPSLPCLHQAKSGNDWLFEPRMNCCCASLTHNHPQAPFILVSSHHASLSGTHLTCSLFSLQLNTWKYILKFTYARQRTFEDQRV